MQLFFGRLDARMATSIATRELIAGFFPGHYDVLPGGVDLDRFAPGSPDGAADERGPVELAFVMDEERASLRLFLRALRRLPPAPDWRATIWTARSGDPPPRIGARLRERVRFTGADEVRLEDLLQRSDLLCAASGGVAPA